ncbi:MAG: hypothetical protein U1F43_37830 [Myxococcota bacterium]
MLPFSFVSPEDGWTKAGEGDPPPRALFSRQVFKRSDLWVQGSALPECWFGGGVQDVGLRVQYSETVRSIEGVTRARYERWFRKAMDLAASDPKLRHHAGRRKGEPKWSPVSEALALSLREIDPEAPSAAHLRKLLPQMHRTASSPK